MSSKVSIELLMTQPSMNTSKSVCSSRHAWGLDNRIRTLVQNPYKIVEKYIEEGQTVLDLGCGPGVFSLAMAKIVGETGKVISVDIQEEMLEMLKRKSEKAGLGSRILIHRSLPDKIGISEKVDFALAFYVVHEVPNTESFLRDVVMLLKPQAKLLVVEPKIHVSKSSFEDTIGVAQSAGLRTIYRPKVFFSRAALLQRDSI